MLQCSMTVTGVSVHNQHYCHPNWALYSAGYGTMQSALIPCAHATKVDKMSEAVAMRVSQSMMNDCGSMHDAQNAACRRGIS